MLPAASAFKPINRKQQASAIDIHCMEGALYVPLIQFISYISDVPTTAARGIWENMSEANRTNVLSNGSRNARVFGSKEPVTVITIPNAVLLGMHIPDGKNRDNRLVIGKLLSMLYDFKGQMEFSDMPPQPKTLADFGIRDQDGGGPGVAEDAAGAGGSEPTEAEAGGPVPGPSGAVQGAVPGPSGAVPDPSGTVPGSSGDVPGPSGAVPDPSGAVPGPSCPSAPPRRSGASGPSFSDRFARLIHEWRVTQKEREDMTKFGQDIEANNRLIEQNMRLRSALAVKSRDEIHIHQMRNEESVKRARIEKSNSDLYLESARKRMELEKEFAVLEANRMAAYENHVRMMRSMGIQQPFVPPCPGAPLFPGM